MWPSQSKDESIDSVNEEYDIDDAKSNIWNHIKYRWCLYPPKLVISIADDTETHLMNHLLLKSILVDLVKAAAAAKGIHFLTSQRTVTCALACCVHGVCRISATKCYWK